MRIRIRRPGRWLLVLTPVVVAVVLLILSWPRIQENLLKSALRERGAKVVTIDGGPRFLRSWSLAWFEELAHVQFSDARPSFTLDDMQSFLERLRFSRSLLFLGLGGTPIRNEELIHLKYTPQLTGLDLSYTLVTDDGLRHLMHCRELTTLSVIGTQVTDSGLPHLQHLPKLQTLWLDGTQVSDEGMAWIATNMPELEELSVSNTNVTEAGIRVLLDRLPNLNVTDD